MFQVINITYITNLKKRYLKNLLKITKKHIEIQILGTTKENEVKRSILFLFFFLSFLEILPILKHEKLLVFLKIASIIPPLSCDKEKWREKRNKKISKILFFEQNRSGTIVSYTCMQYCFARNWSSTLIWLFSKLVKDRL